MTESRRSVQAEPAIRVLFTADQIAVRVREMGLELARDYAGKNPLFVGVLKGACMFQCDLARATPFDVELDQLFDMNHTYDQVVAGLPGSTAELTTPAFFAAIHDPNSPIRVHLRENAVDDVCLDHPIRMFHMIDADEVPYEIALDALARLSTCNEVELIDWIGTDHLNTWHQTLPEVRSWFDSF